MFIYSAIMFSMDVIGLKSIIKIEPRVHSYLLDLIPKKTRGECSPLIWYIRYIYHIYIYE